jgi:O-antigen ligase
MNDLSTSKPSKLHNTWSSLPWGTILFLLAVFVFSTPLVKFGFMAHKFGDTQEYLASGGFFNERILALILLGAFALFNLLRSKPGRFQINGLLGWLILFYLVWAALSIIWSIDARFTLKRVGILLILSLGALYVAERFSLRETFALVFFICAVSLLIGVVTVSLNPFELRSVLFWNSRFGGNMHPIAQGWNCGLLLLSAFALYKTDEKNRAVYLGIAFITFLLLILTRSRMPVLSFIMGSAVYWILTSSKRYQGVLFFLLVIIFVCSMYFLLGHEFKDESLSMINLGRSVETVQSMTGRRPLWEKVMLLVHYRPFTGYGYDSVLVSKNLIWIKEQLSWATPSPHSGYIATLGGLGYIGAVTLVLILILSVKMSISLARRNPEYAFITAVLVWLISNMFTEEQILTRPYFVVFVWMILLARLGFIREKR